MRNDKMKGFALFIVLGMVFLAGCGGGGGGGTAATPATSTNQLATSPGSGNTAYVTGRQETATTSYTVTTVPTPTVAEIAQMEAVDAGVFSAAARIADRAAAQGTSNDCTPVASSDYTQFFNTVVSFYNQYRGSSSWPTGVNNLAAGFRTSKSQRVSTEFNVFECAENTLNALAGYRNVFVYDGLIKILDEATDLLYFVDSATEYDYYLRQIVDQYVRYGLHFQVVSPALHNALASNSTYGPQAALIFAQALAYAVGHEMGHGSMAHMVQKLRYMNNNGVSLANAVLSFAHEFQADIYSTTLLRLGGESLNGADLTMYILEIGEGYSSGVEPFVSAHPPATSRRSVLRMVNDGMIATSVLTPIYTYARVPGQSRQAAKWEGFGKLRKKQLPLMQ